MVKPPDERKIKKPEAGLQHDFQLSGGFLPGVQSPILKLSALDVKSFLRRGAIGRAAFTPAGRKTAPEIPQAAPCRFLREVSARNPLNAGQAGGVDRSSAKFFYRLTCDRGKIFKMH
jgi:hypothetical protein